MTSYFEKLTSINTSSLNLIPQKFQPQQTPDLSTAIKEIEQLKNLNTKLELDLKCEHDEKSELVSLKVALESEILELREVNERLDFQVEQLKDEKDKIHHVLAAVKEESVRFIATSGGVSGGGVMKKFPSLDDLTTQPPPPSPTRPLTPTSSTSYTQLEPIDELPEDYLESLPPQKPQTQPTPEQLMKRIAFLESENNLLRTSYCPNCHRTSKREASSNLIFEHEDEGLVLSAVDEEESPPYQEGKEEEQINDILEMQRKIIEKLEKEVYKLEEVRGGGIQGEVWRMKEELEKRMKGIVRGVHNREGD